MHCLCHRVQWTFGTRHTDTDRADMQFKVVFFVALIRINTHIPYPELSCFTVFQNFRFECMVQNCLCEQTAMVDRSHCNNSLNHNELIRNFNLFQPYKFSIFTDRLSQQLLYR